MVSRSKTPALVLGLSFVALSLGSSLPARAETYNWGAISVDLQRPQHDPAYGIGGGDDEQEAVGNAQKFCKESGGNACKAVVTYQQCGAYAASASTGGGWGKNSTKKTAEAKAMSGCDADDCHVVVSDCN
jgi:hypothetical protein